MDDWTKHIRHDIIYKDHPDIADLKEYLDDFPNPGEKFKAQKHLEAIQIKLASEQAKTDTLSQTMTRYQLFLTENPLWAYGINIRAVESVIQMYSAIERPSQAAFFENHFNNYCRNNITIYEKLEIQNAFMDA